MGEYPSPRVVTCPTMPEKPPAKRRPGRPPKGPDGTKVRLLPQVTVRLPVPLMARLVACGKVRGVPMSSIVADALRREFAEIAPEDGRTIGALAQRESARLRLRFPEEGAE